MGIQTPNESRYLHKIDENLNTTKTNYYACFEKSPKSEGAFRYCYCGNIKDYNDKPLTNSYFPKGKCVVKVFKEKVAHYKTDLNEDFKNSIYADKISTIFNSLYRDKLYELKFVIPFAATMQKYASFNLLFFIPIKNSDSEKKIKEDEWIAVEPDIGEPYVKFVSNTNYEHKNLGKAIPAFMHWNWVYTKGEKVVSDVQGVEKDGYYELTDPAVQSINQEYGSPDLGPYGLLVFLAKHKHNEYCKNFPWPNKEDIIFLQSFHQSTSKRTTFSFEFKNDPKIKDIYLSIKNKVFGYGTNNKKREGAKYYPKSLGLKRVNNNSLFNQRLLNNYMDNYTETEENYKRNSQLIHKNSLYNPLFMKMYMNNYAETEENYKRRSFISMSNNINGQKYYEKNMKGNYDEYK